MPSKQQLEQGFRVGDWEVTPGTGVLRKGDQEERPEPMVFKLLMLLAERDGDVLSKNDMIDEIWGGRPIGDEPITQKVSQLRRHLGDSRDPDEGRFRYVENLPKRGYRLNQPVELTEPIAPEDQQVREAVKTRNQGRTWMLVGTVVAILLLAVIIRAVRPPAAPEEIRSLGVLPFEFLSDSQGDQYLAQGLQEEVVRTLQGAPRLAVKIGRRKYENLEVSEIGETLDVDALLFATLQREEERLKLGYRISEAANGVEISAGDIMGAVDDMFGLQERFANLIFEDMLGNSEQKLVSLSRPASHEAYDRYMRGLVAFDRRSQGNNLDNASELFEETIRIDPMFGPAYLALAKCYALLPDYRDAPAEESHKLAIETVERGVAVDESIRDASHMIFGFVYNKQRQYARAEEAYQKAIAADVVDSTAFNWYARMLASTGRSEAALEQALAAQRLDPTSSVLNTLVATMYIWVNDLERAAEYYKRSAQLGGGSLYDYFGYALMLMRQGRLEEAINIANAGATVNMGGNDWVQPLFRALEDPSQRERAVTALEEASNAGRLDPRLHMALRVFLGDVDGGMKIALDLASPGMHRPMDMLFLPELRPLREHEDFPRLTEMLGIRDYWDEKGCVWLDDSISCPD